MFLFKATGMATAEDVSKGNEKIISGQLLKKFSGKLLKKKKEECYIFAIKITAQIIEEVKKKKKTLRTGNHQPLPVCIGHG